MGQRQTKVTNQDAARHATRHPRGDQEETEATGRRRPLTTPAAAMDTFFLSHGSPMVSIDETIPARKFFQSWLPAAVAGPGTPRAILVVSAHWETATPAVNVIRGNNDTIYDFGGFPRPMYQVRPRAPSCFSFLGNPR